MPHTFRLGTNGRISARSAAVTIAAAGVLFWAAVAALLVRWWL